MHILRSSVAPKSKLLFFISMIFVCLACFPKNSFSQKFERNGDVVTYRGNKFEYLQNSIADTQIVTDPVDGHKVMKITTKDPIPTKMNGIKIYNTDEVTHKPVPVSDKMSLELYIFKGLSNELNKLPDGSYYLYISNIIIDNKGKLVYYEYDGLTSRKNKPKVPVDIKKAIDNKIDALMNKAPAFNPGSVNDHNVIVRTDIMLSMFTIVVKKHKAIFTRE